MIRWPRGAAGIALRLALVTGIGLSSSLPVRSAAVVSYRVLLGGLLSSILHVETAAGAVRATLEPYHGSVRDDASWDTSLRLAIPDLGELDHVVLNLRRSSYIPLLGFVAVVVAAPLAVRRRLRVIALGVPLLLVYSFLCTWGTAHWLLLRIPGIAREASTPFCTFIDLVYRALIVPESNRYIVPLLCAALLIVWQGALPEEPQGGKPSDAPRARRA